MFQSRNRGSFDFKLTLYSRNLLTIAFQSRNRGSFDFKLGNVANRLGGFTVSIS